jgi:plasmid stability protein
MAQILIRKLDDDVKAKLQRRAQRHGRSTEAEAREILGNAVHSEEREPVGLGSQIAARFKEIGLEEREEIRELRGHPVRPAQFDE